MIIIVEQDGTETVLDSEIPTHRLLFGMANAERTPGYTRSVLERLQGYPQTEGRQAAIQRLQAHAVAGPPLPYGEKWLYSVEGEMDWQDSDGGELVIDEQRIPFVAFETKEVARAEHLLRLVPDGRLYTFCSEGDDDYLVAGLHLANRLKLLVTPPLPYDYVGLLNAWEAAPAYHVIVEVRSQEPPERLLAGLMQDIQDWAEANSDLVRAEVRRVEASDPHLISEVAALLWGGFPEEAEAEQKAAEVLHHVLTACGLS